MKERKEERKKERKNQFRSLYTVSVVIEIKVVIGWLNYNFECDWLIELSDNQCFNGIRVSTLSK